MSLECGTQAALLTRAGRLLFVLYPKLLWGVNNFLRQTTKLLVKMQKGKHSKVGHDA